MKYLHTPVFVAIALLTSVAAIVLNLAHHPTSFTTPPAAGQFEAAAAIPVVKDIDVLDGHVQGVDKDQGGQVFNLMAGKYGINPNNCDSNDNTAKIQAWANDVCAAHGTGYVPSTARQILFKSPVTFQPQGTATSCSIRIISQGNLHTNSYSTFTFTGTGNTGVWIFKGLRGSLIDGLGTQLGTPGQQGMAVLDFQYTAPYVNAGYNLFENCWVNFGSGGCKNCRAFRLGQAANGDSNGPFMMFSRCCVNDASSNNGNVGFHIGGSQNYVPLLIGCAGAQLGQYVVNGSIASPLTRVANNGDTTLNVVSTFLFPTSGTIAINNKPFTYSGKTATSFTGVQPVTGGPYAANSNVMEYVPGQGVYPGSGLLTVQGGGASNNIGDFLQNVPSGTLRIIGGRFETGKQFYTDATGSNGTLATHLEHEGGYLAAYSQPTAGNGVYWARTNGTIAIKGVSYYANAMPWSKTNPLITNNVGTGNTKGSITMERCDVYGNSGANLFILNPKKWPQTLRNVQTTDKGGHVQSIINSLSNGAI